MTNINITKKLKFFLITALICSLYAPLAKALEYRQSLTPFEEEDFVKAFIWENSKTKSEKIASLEKNLITKLEMLNPIPGYIFNTTTWKGKGLIHLASYYPFYENFLKKLIERGEDVKMQTQDTKATPLHFACQASLNNIKTLMDTGKIENLALTLDASKKNPLHYLADVMNQKMDKKEMLEAISYLWTKNKYNPGQSDGAFTAGFIKFGNPNVNKELGQRPSELIKDKPGYEEIYRALLGYSTEEGITYGINRPTNPFIGNMSLKVPSQQPAPIKNNPQPQDPPLQRMPGKMPPAVCK